MRKKIKEKWQLDPDEVQGAETSHAIGHRRRLIISSRSTDERSLTLKLTHVPTGFEVEGEIPKGHYTRKKLNQLREGLYNELFEKLEARVAKHLRISRI